MKSAQRKADLRIVITTTLIPTRVVVEVFLITEVFAIVCVIRSLMVDRVIFSSECSLVCFLKLDLSLSLSPC